MRMPVSPFREPFLYCGGTDLVPTNLKSFFMVNEIETSSGNLLANVLPSGSAELAWLIDHDGKFFAFTSLGLEPATVVQRLKLYRRRERYRIEQPRRITVGELLELVEPVKDRLPEAPVGRVVRSRLKKLVRARLIDSEVMTHLMGG